MQTISRLAATAGLEAKTLRYYDRVGLVRPVKRSLAGYRLYDESAAHRLRFIMRAKTLGMSLADIRRILAFRDEGAAPCTHVLELVGQNITRIEAQLADLQQLRQHLRLLRRVLRRRLPRASKVAAECQCIEIIAEFKKGKP